LELRERVALLGEFEFFESKWDTFAEWLDLPPASFNSALRIAAIITSTLVAGVFVGGVAGLLPWARVALWIAPLAAFHSVVGLIFRDRVNRMIVQLRPVSFETQVLREGLQLLEEHPFQSPKLLQIADRVRNSSKSVRRLERLLNALNERNKEWFYAPSLLLLLGTQLCMAVEHWRIEHRAAFRTWLDSWAEFEALNALANYAYENAENAFPEFSADGARFEAEALGHPLLPNASCVRNDVQLNTESRFYIVSGSNMSGKSTLLRAIGLNAVLALAGAPVRARALRLSRLSVCASLAVVDSLLSGKSKFMAEVDRLRQTIQVAMEGEAVLFLIDEILGGTNSRDRRVAAEAVVRALVSRGAIGAFSTHDLALGEIAAADLGGVNVHTGSRDGSDPMDFDYRLKPGVTNEANALAIARMAGVPT
jgi:DNA mismatch repair ATPase MutS